MKAPRTKVRRKGPRGRGRGSTCTTSSTHKRPSRVCSSACPTHAASGEQEVTKLRTRVIALHVCHTCNCIAFACVCMCMCARARAQVCDRASTASVRNLEALVSRFELVCATYEDVFQPLPGHKLDGIGVEQRRERIAGQLGRCRERHIRCSGHRPTHTHTNSHPHHHLPTPGTAGTAADPAVAAAAAAIALSSNSGSVV